MRLSSIISMCCVLLAAGAYLFAVLLGRGFGNASGPMPFADMLPAILALVAWGLMAYFLRGFFSNHPVMMPVTGLLIAALLGLWAWFN